MRFYLVKQSSQDFQIGQRESEFLRKFQEFYKDYRSIESGSIQQAHSFLKASANMYDAVILSEPNVLDNALKNYLKEKAIPILDMDKILIESLVEDVRQIVKSHQDKIDQAKKFSYENYIFTFKERFIEDSTDGSAIILTPTENNFFWILLKASTQPMNFVTKENLLTALPNGVNSNEAIIERHMSSLRDKLRRMQIPKATREGYRIEFPLQERATLAQWFNINQNSRLFQN